MASMCVKRLKYLIKIFTMLKMTFEFDNRLTYVENCVHMYEIA